MDVEAVLHEYELNRLSLIYAKSTSDAHRLALRAVLNSFGEEALFDADPVTMADVLFDHQSRERSRGQRRLMQQAVVDFRRWCVRTGRRLTPGDPTTPAL